jgi:hypothetical protein
MTMCKSTIRESQPACDGVATVSSETIVFERKAPAAIRPLGTTGKVPVMTEGMRAIQIAKTMAGSPDAETRSASRNLAHGFCVLERAFVRELMKENRNVQYSFSGNRLGWTSAQA